MPNNYYEYPEPDVIDLTNSIIYSRAPVNFANNANSSVILIDDSFDQDTVCPTVEHTVQVSNNLTPSPVRKRKSRPKKATPKKKRKANNGTEEGAVSVSRDHSPLTSSRLGDCPICAEPLGTKPMSSTNCGHVFCTECIKKALRIQKRCPTCRKGLSRCSYPCHPLFL